MNLNTENFNGVKIIIHRAGNGKANLNAFGEFIDSTRHFNINFSLECFNLNIPYIFEAQFLSPFPPSLNEEKFIPLLINYACFCYKWVNDFVVPLGLIDEECFLINYGNAFNKGNCNIILNVKESKERALNIKQDFVKMTWHTTHKPENHKPEKSHGLKDYLRGLKMFGMVNAYCDTDFNGDFIKVEEKYFEHQCLNDCCKYFLLMDVVVSIYGLSFKYTSKIGLPVLLRFPYGKEWDEFLLNCLAVVYENVLYFNFKSINEDYKKGYALVSWPIYYKGKTLMKLECSKLLENASKVAKNFVLCKRVKEFIPLHVINQR